MSNTRLNVSVLLVFVLMLSLTRRDAIAQNDVIKDDVTITKADRLRGSITPERAWWDLLRYDLALEVFPESRSIKGSNKITFRVIKPTNKKMQIDLQEPLEITRIEHGDTELKFERDGNVYWVSFPNEMAVDAESSILIHYEGNPVVSKNPPWSGGFSWQTDEKGQHFIATSCQGIGASIWWPNKDHGYDEPDKGMTIDVTVPKDLIAVSNGRLKSTESRKEKTKSFTWEVVNPINNYGVNVNIGNYVNFSETLEGEGGKLDVDYWVLAHQKETAKKHFKEVPRTLRAFEHWFGKYPFYEDSFKIVVVPYLGMEHQSSVTYGNKFQNGYNGRDLSGTGVGMKFDFIVVHESGHEWFGNNISMVDAADMWIHEGFTNYSENLFVEYHFSEQEAQDYVIGCRKLVSNDRPIIGVYNANMSGSGDMYYKGGNLLHTIRHIIDDDEKWRQILRGLNEDFWHTMVTTEQVENYISEKSGIDFSKYFDQYLRTTKIPVFKYSKVAKTLNFQFDNVVAGFEYPIKVKLNGREFKLLANSELQTFQFEDEIRSVDVDRNFYATKRIIKD